MSRIYPNVVSAAGVKKKQKYIAVSLMYDASLEFDAGLNLFFLVSLFPSCLLFVVLWPHLPKIFSPNTNTLNLYALENKIFLYSLSFPPGLLQSSWLDAGVNKKRAVSLLAIGRLGSLFYQITSDNFKLTR